MLCELIALACLTAHGDIPAVQASKKLSKNTQRIKSLNN
jgi:hypothetical protein